MEYVFFNYLTPPPSPPPQTIFKVVYGNHLVYLSVCLSVRLSAKFVSGQYISFGETLVPTWQKDCLWPEGVLWSETEVIWAMLRSLGAKVENSCPVHILKIEKHWKFLLDTKIACDPMENHDLDPRLFGQGHGQEKKKKCIFLCGKIRNSYFTQIA